MSAPMSNEISQILLNFHENLVNKNNHNVLTSLKSLSTALRNEECRDQITPTFLDEAESLVDSMISTLPYDDHQLQENELENEVLNLEILTEVFRCFRNGCAACRKNQIDIGRRDKFLKNTKRLLERLMKYKSNTGKLSTYRIDNQNVPLVNQCLYTTVQFLGNLVTDCPVNHHIVWSKFSEIFRALLNETDASLTNFTCMVLFNCQSEDVRKEQLTTNEGVEIVEEILKVIGHQDIEWGIYYLEDLMRRPELMTYAYGKLQDSERVTLLDFILAEVTSCMDRDQTHGDVGHHILPGESLHKLSAEFKENSHQILTNCQLGENACEVKLVLKVLGILCTATSSSGDYSLIQDDQDLLKCCIHLLHAMFMIGQQGENPFTSKKLAQMSDSDTDDAHPVYGLKRDLIRLIGNMVYRNKHNQNKVREMGGIALILDHANIDGRNPFILQWTILTIRNLCEENLENQAVIAKMNLQGVANSAQLLRDFGVNAVLEDGKIVVKKEDKK